MYTVSIIIPFYNAQQYIKRCLDSIISQSYINWEAILINDGSNDQSAKICYEYTQKDNRIYLYNKEKEGVSTARNYGIKKSKGNYIMFIDIDDAIEPDCLDTMINIISEDNEIDIVRSAFARVYPENTYIVPNKWEGKYDKEYIINTIIPDYIGPSDKDFPYNITFCSIWASLYKKELIEGINFNKDLSIMEDKVFLIEALFKARKIYYTNKVLYKYYINANSTLNKYHSNYVNNQILVVKLIKELSKNNKSYNIYRERINNLIIIIWRAICQNEVYATLPITESIKHIKLFSKNINPSKRINLIKKFRLIKDHPTWLLLLFNRYDLYIKLWRKHLNISHE